MVLVTRLCTDVRRLSLEGAKLRETLPTRGFILAKSLAKAKNAICITPSCKKNCRIVQEPNSCATVSCSSTLELQVQDSLFKCWTLQTCKNQQTFDVCSLFSKDKIANELFRSSNKPNSVENLHHLAGLRPSDTCRFGPSDSIEAPEVEVARGVGQLCLRHKELQPQWLPLIFCVSRHTHT